MVLRPEFFAARLAEATLWTDWRPLFFAEDGVTSTAASSETANL